MENIKFKLPVEPNKISESFADAYNTKDINNLLKLFEQNARSVNQKGDTIS